MTWVITKLCRECVDMSCVEVCPVDCIHPGEYRDEVFMVIHPDNCIDCELCKPACPIDAIVETEEESPEWAEINAELAPDWEDHEAVQMRERDDPPRKPGNVIVNP